MEEINLKSSIMSIRENINESFFDFIAKNKDADIDRLLFKYHGQAQDFNLQLAVIQIAARKKTVSKLSDFLNYSEFIFPDSLAAEQSTDQRVARYHASLVGSGKKVLDMTAGLGIDAMTIASAGNQVVACDIDESRTYFLRHNANVLGLRNLTAINCDCTSLDSSNIYDVIFIDPARRDANSRRTYSFAECSPDVISLMPKMQIMSDRILIKASPMLDISQIRHEIQDISMIHIVCVKGECKEVLVDIRKSSEFNGIKIVDLADAEYISEIQFSPAEIALKEVPIADMSEIAQGNYLYEPNAGVMKVDCRSAICNRFDGLKRIANDTSLYVSEYLFEDFPGRISKIETIGDKPVLKFLKNERYNIVSRNYPLSADEIRKKYKLKEGYDKYLYAFRCGEKNTPIICLTNRININKNI